MDFGSALMALLLFGVLKIAVMVATAVITVRLYRSSYGRSDKKLWLLLPDDDKPEVRILWWALALFAFSELVCGVEIYVLLRSSPIIAIAHAISSAAGMALFAVGITLHLDRKLVRFGSKRCAVNSICKGCPVRNGDACRFQNGVALVGVFVVLAAFAPLFASTERMIADPTPYVLPFESWNAWYDQTVVPWLLNNMPGYSPNGEAYGLPTQMLIFEWRVLPMLAAGMALGGMFLLRRGYLVLGLRVITAAAGVLAYTYFELVCYGATQDVIAGSLGHELAEFWFLLATAEFLRRSFPTGAESPSRGATA